jgi:hypothetical protein
VWELARRDRWLALGSLIHVAINLIYSVGYNVTDAFVHLLPVYFYAALWMGQGAVSLLGALAPLRGPGRRQGVVAGLVAAGLLLLPLISLVEEWRGMDLTHEREAQTYAQEALEAAEPGSLILVGSDAHTFALWYYYYVEELRPDVLVVNYAMAAFDWYQRTLATHHPEVALPGPGDSGTSKLDSVLRNLERGTVYIAEDEGDLGDLELTPVGPLWRVTKP